MNYFDNFKNKQLIIAHRGFKAEKPENTLEAFLNALGRCDLVEFDVHFTKDYIPVLSHDDFFKVSEEEVKISNLFHKDINTKTLKKDILDLESFLDFAKKNSLYFNLEIKTIDKKLDNSRCIDIILKLLEKYKSKRYVCISSFEHEYLIKIQSIDKSIALCALDEKGKKRENLLSYIKKLNVISYNIDMSIYDKNLVKDLNDLGIEVMVFTINQKEEIEKLFEEGVKGIFTDKYLINYYNK